MRELARTERRYRGLLAGGLVAAAVAVALHTLAPDPVATAPVVAARHDLAPGAVLTTADVTVLRVPTALVPAGVAPAAGDVVGRAVAGRVRRGEPLTDVRLLGAGLLTDPGTVAAPVRLADPATAALLHAGDRVDVLATPSEGGAATTVARELPVLAVPRTDDGDGALVVLGATPAEASRLAGAAVGSRLSVTVLPA